MPARLPLSVYYITLNEQDRLPDSLEKVRGWADEIVVVDSGSSDRTVSIAESYGARVVHREWEGFASQKAYAESLCHNPWVFNLDADEVLSDAAVASIHRAFREEIPDDVAGFALRWVTVPPLAGHPFRHDKRHYLLRLYHRDRAGFAPDRHSIHDRPVAHSGRVVRIKGDVFHQTLVSLQQLEEKYRRMSSDQALYLVEKGRRISSARLFVEFPLKFLKYYFLHRQFMNGWFGLAVAITAANRNFMRLAKARELQLLEQLGQRREPSDSE